jgi:hypothetical protein
MTKLNNLYNIIAEDDSDDAQTIVESFNAHGAFIRVDVVANGKELARR